MNEILQRFGALGVMLLGWVLLHMGAVWDDTIVFLLGGVNLYAAGMWAGLIIEEKVRR